ncbi:MAG: DUF4298 domain-containing protein [Butyrivibrio sp.]|nr:DUF4298 domain-containing protein [Butyrivibrio sp.]
MGTNFENNRVIEMEQLLTEALKAQSAVKPGDNRSCEDYLKLQSAIQRLADYYESPEWKRDFERDEKGEIPKDIARGVLSEDGIYNMLERNRDILDEIVGSHKIVVIFPGIGYHSDKPLLYFTKKLARENGYIVFETTYEFPNKPGDIKGNREKMKDAFEIAMEQAAGQLSPLKLGGCGDVLFVGKSIGTAISAYYNEQNKIGARQILFTPVPQTFELLMPGSTQTTSDGDKATGSASGSESSNPGSTIVFHGNADPWCPTDIAIEMSKELDLPLYITDNANHSLETGAALTDIANLETILGTVSNYIKEA